MSPATALRRHRSRVFVGGLVGIAAPVTVLCMLPSWPELSIQLRDPRIDVAVGALALAAGAVLVIVLAAWSAVIGLAALLAAAPGAVGRVGVRLVTAITPVVLRRLLLATAGLSIAAASTACSVSSASAMPSVPVQSAAVAISGSEPGPGTAMAISLDWPVAAEPAPASDSASAPTRITVSSSEMRRQSGRDHRRAAPAATTTAPAAPRPEHLPRDVAADSVRAETEPPAEAIAEAATVTVRSGDSLWRIAASRLPAGASGAEIDRAWRLWYQTNLDTIGTDPNLLLPGQVLRAPTQLNQEIR